MTAALRHCQSCGSEMHRQRPHARFCSSRCKQASYRARQPVTVSEPFKRALMSQNPAAAISLRISRETDKCVTVSVPPLRKGYQIIPEEKWPSMFRIRRPDGALTDMVNLTRALDALAAFDEATS